MKHIAAGIFAHVDAGKTTLSESMLYESGSIRRLGRVDNKDAFLDTHLLERSRGITIFSKQAEFIWKDMRVTLLDTPGHVDFAAEMERTLGVLDYAVLVISGADGVQGHTETLWRLFESYGVPVFLFFNKMDQNGADRDRLLEEVQHHFGDGFVDFTEQTSETFFEKIAENDEAALDCFLENGTVPTSEIRRMAAERMIFPCFFGAALKSDGVREFLDGLERYTSQRLFPEEFSARIYKITRDEAGVRLAHMRVLGGSLKVRSMLGEEKVSQIRIYSGEKYRTVQEAAAGEICAVAGLSSASAGEGFGSDAGRLDTLLEPVLSYRIELPDAAKQIAKFRQLAEEDPKLHIIWNEELKEIQVQLMGEVQLEILKSVIAERFGLEVSFGAGSIVYKETITEAVEGVGHFEPLRHYAEVHLLLEPLPRGRGIVIQSDCSEDALAGNWQRLILTHLREKAHRGVLTGAPVTDIRITLKSGRAHLKHTEGGDFRQATYRAVRQGLMQAASVLLEPVYAFRLEVPEGSVGRAMTDLDKMCAEFSVLQTEKGTAVLTGKAPVSEMLHYQKETAAYTGGRGRLFLTFDGYAPCHNADAVIESMRYDPERDEANPSGSVFCAHGAGFYVPWDHVWEHMHLKSIFDLRREPSGPEKTVHERRDTDRAIGVEEIDRIIDSAGGANRRQDGTPARRQWSFRRSESAAVPAVRRQPSETVPQEEYLLVDGYNVIYAWEGLRTLAEENIDGARGRLLDILCDYQAVRRCHLIAVFDAYRVSGHQTEILDYHNIHVVYTKEAETADQYIEKFAHENGRKSRVTVATSDGLEQIIIRGQGCALISARELEQEIMQSRQQVMEDFAQNNAGGRHYPMEALTGEIRARMQEQSGESNTGR